MPAIPLKVFSDGSCAVCAGKGEGCGRGGPRQ